MIRLQGLKGCCEGDAFQFDVDEITLGRSSTCDVVVDDASCSRQHATIRRSESEYRISDLGSTNGIKVNGAKVEEASLNYGDRFSIGRNLFIFLANIPTDEDDDSDLGVEDLIEVEAAENRLTKNLTGLTQVISVGNAPSVSAAELEMLQKTHQQMHFVYRVSRALNSTLDRDELLALVCDYIFEEFANVERVSIFLASPTDPSRLSECSCVSRGKRPSRPVSRAVLDRVKRERAGILAGNAADDERFATSDSIHRLDLRALMCVPLLIGAKFLGAIYAENCSKIHCFVKSELELFTVLANQAAAAIGNALLYEEIQVSFFETVRSLGNALEAKDKYTRGHSERVARFAVGIGHHLGYDQKRLQTLQVAAELHDIGKIAIDESIIGKDGKLTDAEFDVMKKHPELGVEILRPIRFLKDALPIILHHHERFNGKGYPEGLTGDEIPEEARVLNLADAFDAMTTKRPYNTPATMAEAIARCNSEAGDSFDPRCVDAFVRFLDGEEETTILRGSVKLAHET